MDDTYPDALIKAKVEAPNRAIDEAEFIAKFGPCPTADPGKRAMWQHDLRIWCLAMEHARETL